jgi:hypothetical protein
MKKKQHPLYEIWCAMRQRCNNPKYKQYKDWGGRGIVVCSRWDDFNIFVEDMGPRPDGYILDRIDNEGNYEPSNCRWISRRDSSLNRRRWRKSSKYRGVYFDIEAKKWKAQVTFKNKKYTAGRYDTEEEAYQSYLNKFKQLSKEPEE